ncbi:hypothetical protein MK280_18265 [Myxococcota bacterium]|nr:hypothetical protein [Myxococcota bacterium]
MPRSLVQRIHSAKTPTDPILARLANRWGRRGFCGFIALLLCAAAGQGLAEGSAVVPEWTGDWYLLVHYRDAQGIDPEQVFWDDEVWRLVQTAEGIRWTRHPHAVFDEREGRSVRLPSGEQGQSLGAWWPNPKQRAEIEVGLSLDPFEMKSKPLDREPGGGYRSRSRTLGGSASSVAFVTHWSIELTPAGPVFRQRDTLASGRAQSAQGEAVFRTESVSDKGNAMRGTFRRDGRFEGEFWLWRSPAPTRGLDP